MYEMFLKGGILMIPILIGGVIALAIFAERIFSLRREKIAPMRFVTAIKSLVKENKISEAIVLCEQEQAVISLVLLSGLLKAGKSRDRIKELMEEAGKSVASELERFVAALGTIAAISPLMGLLGTVTGMIKVFQKVTTEGVGDPRILANGIWEALVTTATGLTVAIPAYVAYRYLLSRVDRLLLEMEEISLEIAEEIAEENSGDKA